MSTIDSQANKKSLPPRILLVVQAQKKVVPCSAKVSQCVEFEELEFILSSYL